MKVWIEKLKKLDTVMVIAGVLALVSMIFNPPGKEYLEFIDIRVLCLLFSLMAVIGGLGKEGVFEKIAGILIGKAGNMRMLSGILVGLCFASSMFITNDVALITFVPMTLLMLKGCGQKQVIFVVVLETIGANLGSMLLPFGNPQNLYLYGKYNMQIGEFVGVMLPYWLISLILLAILVWVLVPGEKIHPIQEMHEEGDKEKNRNNRKVILYAVLFLFCICGVLRLVPYYIVTLVVLVTFLLLEPSILKKVDYALLLTFVFFFVFVGNLSRLEVVQTGIGWLLTGREVVVSALVSQVISNVPAALMLSGFTGEGARLLIGVNIGGLGTLIASMASLISYKYYKTSQGADGRSYFVWFTILNVLLLVILLVLQNLFPA